MISNIFSVKKVHRCFFMCCFEVLTCNLLPQNDLIRWALGVSPQVRDSCQQLYFFALLFTSLYISIPLHYTPEAVNPIKGTNVTFCVTPQLQH